MRYDKFYDGYTVDDFCDLLIEYCNFTMGECVDLINGFEEYYGGTLVEISYNAGQAIKDGLLPYIETRYVKNGVYHHFAFEHKNGERFVEPIAFTD